MLRQLQQAHLLGLRSVAVSFPYQYPLELGGHFRDLVAYGRSLGLTVQVFAGGGILTKRGHVRITGDVAPMCEYVRVLRDAIDWTP